MNTFQRACAAFVLMAAGSALGHGMIPIDAPAERLIKNFEAKLKDNPKDAKTLYRLGRTHYLVLEYKKEAVRAWDHRDGPDEVPTEGGWSKGWSDKKGDLAAKDLVPHLVGAITNLNKAIAACPAGKIDEARARLTLACTLEAGAPLRADAAVAPDIGPDPDPKDPKDPKPGDDDPARKLVDSLGKDPKAKERLAKLLDWPSPTEKDGARRALALRLLLERRADPAVKKDVDELLAKDWEVQTAFQFYTAMKIADATETKPTEQPLWGSLLDHAVYEAAQGYIRTEKSTDAVAKKRLDQAKAIVKKLDSLPRPSAITPIILATHPTSSLAELEDRAASTAFNLDGTGTPQRWTWVRPDAGILCWDPAGTGRITSGWQLFGSVSWRLFFEDGYEALDALDDNGDGQLAGPELAGLSVWFDRDGDGLSSPGEVVPVSSLRITSLSCRKDARPDGELLSTGGVTFADGSTLPTYDWIAHRAEAHSPGSRPALYALAALAPGLWLAGRRRTGAPR